MSAALHDRASSLNASRRARAPLLAIAPHLVRQLPIVVPLRDGSPRGGKTTVSLIWRAGNLMRAAARTSRQLLPPPRRISRAEAQTLVPALRTQGLRRARLDRIDRRAARGRAARGTRGGALRGGTPARGHQRTALAARNAD